MRTFLALALAGALSWGAWSMFADEPAPPPRRVSSPLEAFGDDVLRVAIGSPGDPSLAAVYQALNARHFAAGLPPMPVRWEPRLAEAARFVNRPFTLQGLFGHVGQKTAILLNPELKTDRAALDRTLAHEMVHAYLFVTGDPGPEHGPAFQAVLQRLAEEGAFEGTVATDEERRLLRAWLDAESARLASDRDAMASRHRELDQERADLEHARAAAAALDPAGVDALNARLASYNSNAALANDEVGRHQNALDFLNREIDRYNLMLNYPDGLDEGHLRNIEPSIPPSMPPAF